MTDLFSRSTTVATSISSKPGLFALLTVLLTGFLLHQEALAAEGKLIASFTDNGAAANWISVNDGVMGGVSEGGFSISDNNTLLFRGNLSLANNGGFASIRTLPSDMGLSGLASVKVKVRGDGRTYSMDVRVAGQRGASSYRAYFPAPEGAWVTALIPLSDFKYQSFGRELPAKPIDPSAIRSIGFMLADKKEGPFHLEIESVQAVYPDGAADTASSLVDVASAAGTFETLLAAATAAGLADALATGGPFTLFAPTDEAFASLPVGTLDDLLQPENVLKLAGILKYHAVSGRVSLAEALEAKKAPTLQGEPISATFEDGRVKIGPATLIQADIPASNGIIHVIDQVLLPPERIPAAAMTASALIELAIDRGVPLFNHGQPGACVAVYEVTCEALRSMPDIDADIQDDLEQALRKVRAEPSHNHKAWTLRHALDRAYSRLN